MAQFIEVTRIYTQTTSYGRSEKKTQPHLVNVEDIVDVRPRNLAELSPEHRSTITLRAGIGPDGDTELNVTEIFSALAGKLGVSLARR